MCGDLIKKINPTWNLMFPNNIQKNTGHDETLYQHCRLHLKNFTCFINFLDKVRKIKEFWVHGTQKKNVLPQSFFKSVFIFIF